MVSEGTTAYGCRLEGMWDGRNRELLAMKARAAICITVLWLDSMQMRQSHLLQRRHYTAQHLKVKRGGAQSGSKVVAAHIQSGQLAVKEADGRGQAVQQVVFDPELAQLAMLLEQRGWQHPVTQALK